MLILLPALILSQSVNDAQKGIEAMYRKWDKAIVAHDQKALESVLAPSFVAKTNGMKTMNKKEFISAITQSWKVKDAPKDLAFTTKINKVSLSGGLYMVDINESMTVKSKNGKSKKVDFKSLDSWKKTGNSWQIVATKPLD